MMCCLCAMKWILVRNLKQLLWRQFCCWQSRDVNLYIGAKISTWIVDTYKSGDVFPKLVMIGLIRNINAAKLLCHVFACFALWLLCLLAFVAWRWGLVFWKLSPATWKLLLYFSYPALCSRCRPSHKASFVASLSSSQASGNQGGWGERSRTRRSTLPNQIPQFSDLSVPVRFT